MPRPLLCALLLVASLASPAMAQRINLPRPGPREFILDTANLLTATDRETVRAICDRLLTDKATPIVVVTINSMADHGGADLRIETFATLLFDQWQVGHAKLGNHDWNTGILLLVSRRDRKARIELGAGWGREKDAEAMRIMQDLIIPHFKRDDYSTGIVAGVRALDDLARGLELPTTRRPTWHYVATAGAIGLAIFTIVSLVRRGSGGWAWVFWGIVFAVVGTLLYNLLTSRSRGGSGGGGFSGGSFGGGFSGGGGASGSW